jgi:hypothetical protein
MELFFKIQCTHKNINSKKSPIMIKALTRADQLNEALSLSHD